MELEIIKATTQQQQEDCLQVRKWVFYDEMNLPDENERDSQDLASHYWVIYNEPSIPIGTARLFLSESCDYSRSGQPELLGQIGKVAVMSNYRGKGLAPRLLKEIETFAKAHKPTISTLFLQAIADKEKFYTKLGYQLKDSTPFMKKGVPHINMFKHL